MADGLYKVPKQDVGGRFNIGALNHKRNIPVWLKHSRILWPIAGVYFGYTWYLLRNNSIEFTYVHLYQAPLLHTLAVHHLAHVLYMFTCRQGNVRASRHAHDFEPFAAASRVVKMYALLPTSYSHFVLLALGLYLSNCIVLFVLVCGRRFFSLIVSSHLLNYVFVVLLWATTGALLMTPYRPCSGHNRLKLP